jgi:3-hydroxyacyl-CoA dehydrogenase
MGLYNVVTKMGEFSRNPHGDKDFWKPAALLSKLAAEGKGFNG